jgi:hypothetical protein
MQSKRDLEGYLKIDHRDSPGLAAPDLVRAGLPGNMPIGAGKMLEAPTYTCPHCQTVVVINPNRQRERAWCRQCDHYVCDGCGAAMQASGYVHVPFKKVIDDFLNAAAKDKPAPHIVLP